MSRDEQRPPGPRPADKQVSEETTEPAGQAPAEPVPFATVDKRLKAREAAGEEIAAALPDLKPAYVLELERKVEEMEKRLQATLGAYRGQQGELAAVRERLERDRERRHLQDKVKLFRALLDPLDNLERSLAAGQQGGNPVAMLAGIEIVCRQMMSALSVLGLTRFGEAGEPFDPARHEAISTAAVDREDEDGRIVLVQQVGYRLGDEVVRPARVVVGKKDA